MKESLFSESQIIGILGEGDSGIKIALSSLPLVHLPLWHLTMPM
ncbi:hypothetical protein [Gynuella sunshinyii]|nr:hypothetical protein [Gynuella sunshinyii]